MKYIFSKVLRTFMDCQQLVNRKLSIIMVLSHRSHRNDPYLSTLVPEARAWLSNYTHNIFCEVVITVRNLDDSGKSMSIAWLQHP